MKSHLQTRTSKNQPVWLDAEDLRSYAPLDQSVQAHVCVVGAGIAGLSTAYLLAREGRQVVVIDDGPIGGGMTSVTTAHLSNALDDRFAELVRLHGPRGARLAADSHTAAVDLIEAIVRRERMDCGFERLDGYLLLAPGHSEEDLDRELEAARTAGLRDVEKLRRAPLPDFETGPCLRFPNQAQFHPLRYLAGLAQAIERSGGRIFSETHADQITGSLPARVQARGHVITSEAVVVATNSPVNDRLVIHSKQAPYMTYVVGIRVPAGTVPRALFWDTEDPYHYVRLADADGPVLVVGGEDHKTGQEEDAAERFARLDAWARERFPRAGAVEYTWSGQVMEPMDGLAFIGRNPEDHDNVFIATGDSGHGMTHGTIAGILLTDLILGREHPWTTLYDPSRKTLRALGSFLKENLNVAGRYTELLTGGEVESEDEIPRDSGAVVRKGLLKVATYRDEQGVLHRRSAACMHLGCIVSWNQNERTWDCPCHGSRYDRFGTVINGPANQDLPPAEGRHAAGEVT
jgi:glycine/D-amino acid oxidase-like deaminating enzyme/nitrite reductase/ring-hydroxylating ferredoxin subunit